MLGFSMSFLLALVLLSQQLAVVAGEPGWAMHVIDNPNLELPNGLDAADLNGDGLDDYVTNYERTGEIRVAFHPGVSAAKKPWPAITVARFSNTENAAFGDMDGDGQPDIVVALGSESGSEGSGVAIVWAPKPEFVKDTAAWTRDRVIPGTADRGHFHCIKTFDINGDGRLDIVVGGRREGSDADKPGGSGTLAGLKWIESPKESSRDLAKWAVHDIDPAVYSGYGFAFADLDHDGDQDIVLADSDWDTPENERKILWYENPGNGSQGQKEPWPRNIIYRGSEFYTKPQIGVGDLTGNGWPDLAVQTEDSVYLLRNSGKNPVSFRRVAIRKPPMTRQRARPTKVFDINGDGKMDIVGMLIHNEGYLPSDKAAVFWMAYQGALPAADNWKTHVIKMGDGYDGQSRWVGEKWDQALFCDIDRDGDQDIVANCEEYQKTTNRKPQVVLAVVWFENPGR